MHLKIDSQSQGVFKPNHADGHNIAELKKQLIQILQDFPYETINLETDTHINDALDLVKDDIDFDRSSVIVSKDKLIEALLAEKIETKKQEPLKNSHNPAMSALSYFDLVAQNQEQIKAQQFKKFQDISNDLNTLAETMAAFQTNASGDEINLASNDSAKDLIDTVRAKWGLPPGTGPYSWNNRNEVIAFLTQKQKELTHRSQEVMLNLQHSADQLKAMVDATREMIKVNNELCEYINRKTTAG